MFAPLGYLPFVRFLAEIDNLSHEFYHQYALPLAGRSAPNERASAFSRALLGKALYEDWIVDTCLCQQPVPVYLSSPKGKIVVVSPLAFQSRDQLSIYDFDWPLDHHKDELERFLTSEILVEPRFPRLYSFFDEALCVDVDRTDLNGPQVSLDVFEAARRSLKPFKGWSVCISDEDRDELLVAIQEAYVWPQLSSSTGPSNRNSMRRQALGRPRIIDDVAAAYESLFPNGHRNAGVTFKEAARAVGECIKRSVSIDSIKRAIGERK